MKKTLIIALIILKSMILFSQENDGKESNQLYSFSVKINALALPFNNYTLSFDKKIYENYYIEALLGCNFDKISIGNKFMFFTDNDPFWFYTTLKTSLGVNKNLKNAYLGMHFRYKYSYFNNIYIPKYIDFEGDAFDEDWTISKKKYEPGIIIKLGYKFTDVKHFIADFYFGIGTKWTLLNEEVTSKIGYYGVKLNDNYPINNTYSNIAPDFIVGIALGFYK